MLGEAIRLTVFSAQVHVNGPMSHMLLGSSEEGIPLQVQSGGFLALSHVYPCQIVWYSLCTDFLHFYILCQDFVVVRCSTDLA
jgi:hypothetical protein